MKAAWAAIALICAGCHGASNSPPTGESVVTTPAPSVLPAPSASAPPSSVTSVAEPVDASIDALAPVTSHTGACGPTRITVNGKPMSITTARAYGFVTAPGAYVIVLSNKSIPCKDFVKGFRNVPSDEVYVEVGAGPVDNVQQYLNSGNTTVHVPTDVVRAPKKAGDPIEICVRDPGELVPAIGPQNTLAVSGLVKATYCGDVK